MEIVKTAFNTGDDSAFNGTVHASTQQVIKFLVRLVEYEHSGQLSTEAIEQQLVEAAELLELPHIGLQEGLSSTRRVCLLPAATVPLTAAGEVLREGYGYGNFLWGDPDGTLWRYRHGRWRTINPDLIKQDIVQVLLSNAELAPSYRRSYVAEATEVVLTSTLHETPLQRLAENERQPLLNVTNGEIWFNAGEVQLRPHKPWSGQTGLTDVNFDPSATAPQYDTALADIFSAATDPNAMIRHWHEFAGYSVQPQRPISCFWLLFGKGANGKSKLLDVVRKLLGLDKVLSEPISRFQRDNFAIASLAGKRLLIDDDVDENLILDDGLIKKLSEAKPFTARNPYGKRKQEFISLAMPVMAGNHYPATRDVSPGMQRRTYVIPFERVFSAPQQDPHIFDTLWHSERSGILNHVLAGFCRVVARGYQFDEPPDCTEARKRFFLESNPLRSFLDERCKQDASAKLRVAQLRVAFFAWASENGVSRTSMAGNKLKRNLELLGFEIKQMKGYPYVIGLALKPLE